MTTWIPLIPLAAVVGGILLHLLATPVRRWMWIPIAVMGVVLLASLSYWGLVWAPPERDMGDVYRILYVHVPQVWMALLCLTLNFGASVAFLLRKSWTADCIAEASAEVGVFFGVVGVTLGAIWARPTWGVYWDWDPRLTTAAVMIVIYTGYLALRQLVDDPDKRAVWSAAVAIFNFVDIPVLWFSVRWWRSLHQIQSSPKTVDAAMTAVLRWSATGFLCVMFVFLWHRYLLARRERQAELQLPTEGFAT